MDKPIPYKGRKPYIFISYAHADSARVWPILNRLSADGFRFWYDEGIDPGTEWADDIQHYLDKCTYFFAFLSRRYLDSDNCKDELHQARESQVKNRLLIYLDDVQLEGGMALRNSRLQAIHWHSYANADEAFAKLYTARDLVSCHETGHIPEITVSAEPGGESAMPQQPPQPEPTAQKGNSSTITINVPDIDLEKARKTLDDATTWVNEAATRLEATAKENLNGAGLGKVFDSVSSSSGKSQGKDQWSRWLVIIVVVLVALSVLQAVLNRAPWLLALAIAVAVVRFTPLYDKLKEMGSGKKETDGGAEEHPVTDGEAGTADGPAPEEAMTAEEAVSAAEETVTAVEEAITAETVPAAEETAAAKTAPAPEETSAAASE